MDNQNINELRRKAERHLSSKKPDPSEIPSKDPERLIHELRVHQIELEMQNDELRKAQEEIEESRSRYVDLYDFAPVGYLTLDKIGSIVEANLMGASFLKMERRLILKTPFSVFILPEDRDLFRDFQRRVFQPPGKQSCELRLKGKASDPFWVRLEGVAVEAPAGKLTGMRLVLSDISERKRSENELRASEKRLQDLSSRLLQIQETERKVIANEIHDGLLSDLAAMAYSMESNLLNLEKTGNPVAPGLRRLLELQRRTMKEARRIMNRLRPAILDESRLIPALNAVCREFKEVHPQIHLECKLESIEDEIPESIKVVIYRVAQEALTNAARHGKGTSVKLSLERSSNRIEFLIQDDGQGFDLKNAKKGVGLESMRDRVELSGGTFQVESVIGQGTEIRAIWNQASISP